MKNFFIYFYLLVFLGYPNKQEYTLTSYTFNTETIKLQP